MSKPEQLRNLAPGSRILLTGPNGAGKTTMLRQMAGLPPPGSDNLTGRPKGHFVAERPLDGLVGLTVAGEARMRRRLLPPAFQKQADAPIATLSAGQARELALQMLGTGPWFLDEPAADLDDEALARLVAAVANHPGPVVFTDHTNRLAHLATAHVPLGPSQNIQPSKAVPPVGNAISVQPAHIQSRGIHIPGQELMPGLTVVVGPNGSGKTTWLEHLAGLHQHPSPAPCSYLPRHAALMLGEPVDAAQQPGSLCPPELDGRHPLSLSAGEGQRVAVAKALALETPLVLLDEPEVHMDSAGQQALADCLAGLVKRGTTVVIATHSSWLAAMANHTVRLP